MAGGRSINIIIIDRMTIKIIIVNFWWTQEKRLLRRQCHRQGGLHGAAVVAAAAVGHQSARTAGARVRRHASIACEFQLGRRDSNQRAHRMCVAGGRCIGQSAKRKGGRPNGECDEDSQGQRLGRTGPLPASLFVAPFAVRRQRAPHRFVLSLHVSFFPLA